jgi:tRNA-dihydrouridine synthase
VPADPTIEERFALAIEHAKMAEQYQHDPRGAAIEFRKHLGWYVKGLPGSAELRKQLYAVTSMGEVEGILGGYLQSRLWITDAPEAETSELEPIEA